MSLSELFVIVLLLCCGDKHNRTVNFGLIGVLMYGWSRAYLALHSFWGRCLEIRRLSQNFELDRPAFHKKPLMKNKPEGSNQLAMAQLIRSAKSGSDWTGAELLAYNIAISLTSLDVFF